MIEILFCYLLGSIIVKLYRIIKNVFTQVDQSIVTPQFMQLSEKEKQALSILYSQRIQCLKKMSTNEIQDLFNNNSQLVNYNDNRTA